MRRLLAAVLLLGALPAAAADEEYWDPDIAQHDHGGAHSAAAAPAAEPTATAPAQAPAASADGKETVKVNATVEEKQERGGFHWGVGLNHQMGQSTLKAPLQPANAEMLMDIGAALSVNGSYGFEAAGVQLSASGGANVSMEYSTPDNATGRRFNWSDIRLGLAAPAIYREKFSGISVTPSLSASIPISLSSRWQNVITSTSLGVSLARNFGKVTTRLSLGASKGFYTSQSAGPNPEQAKEIRDSNQTQLFLCRADDVHCFGGLHPNYSLSTGLGASWSPIEKLQLSIGFGLSKTVKYAFPIDDELASKAIDSNGDRVVVQTGSGDMMTGSIGASYAITDQLGLGLSMNTAQQPFYNSEYKGIRFPFYAFEGQERSFTSFSLSLSSSF